MAVLCVINKKFRSHINIHPRGRRIDFLSFSTGGRNPCPEQSEGSFRFLVADASRNDNYKGLEMNN